MYVLELAGEDDSFAAAEARTAATEVNVIAPGLAVADTIHCERVRGLAYTHRVSTLIGRDKATPTCARNLVSSADLDVAGSIAVRARNVRGISAIDTKRVERELGADLVARGFEIELDRPDHELRVLFSDYTCAVGLLVCESVRDYGSRAPTTHPFFHPGAMDPLDARAIANMALLRTNHVLLDPMCGTGGILIEAGLLGAPIIGMDVQLKMVAGTVENLTKYVNRSFTVMTGDARRIPIRDNGVDCVSMDLPYGRQSKIAGSDSETLRGEVIEEARRVADRAVIVADRSLEPEAQTAGWVVEDIFDRRVHRSLTRYIHVLN